MACLDSVLLQVQMLHPHHDLASYSLFSMDSHTTLSIPSGLPSVFDQAVTSTQIKMDVQYSRMSSRVIPSDLGDLGRMFRDARSVRLGNVTAAYEVGVQTLVVDIGMGVVVTVTFRVTVMGPQQSGSEVDHSLSMQMVMMVQGESWITQQHSSAYPTAYLPLVFMILLQNISV